MSSQRPRRVAPRVQAKRATDEEKTAEGRTGPTKISREPISIRISRRARNLLLLAALVALAFVVWRAPGVLFVAVLGITLALVLSFPVRELSGLLPRGLAIAVSFLGLVAAVVIALWVVVPLLLDQLRAFLASAPAIAGGIENALRGLLAPLAERGFLSETPEDLVADLERDLSLRAQDLAEGLLGSLVGLLRGALSFAVGLLASLVVAGYLLADARKIKAAYLRAIPNRYRYDARELWDAFGLSLSRYLGGLAFVALVQGVLSAVVLWLLGVPYATLLGAWVAITAVVPLLGAWLGAIPAVLVALSISPTVALFVAVLFLAIQQLEGHLLTPRVLGDALGVHPVLVILAVIGGGQLVGPLGVLLAVPALAVSKVLFDFLRPRLKMGSESSP